MQFLTRLLSTTVENRIPLFFFENSVKNLLAYKSATQWDIFMLYHKLYLDSRYIKIILACSSFINRIEIVRLYEYQAAVPDGLCWYDDTLPYENEDILLWDLKILPEEKTESETNERLLKKCYLPLLSLFFFVVVILALSKLCAKLKTWKCQSNMVISSRSCWYYQILYSSTPVSSTSLIFTRSATLKFLFLSTVDYFAL